jgi:hypothetical protein
VETIASRIGSFRQCAACHSSRQGSHEHSPNKRHFSFENADNKSYVNYINLHGFLPLLGR